MMVKDQQGMPGNNQNLQEMDEFKRKIKDAFEPAIRQNDELRRMLWNASAVLPKFPHIKKPAAVEEIMRGIESARGSWIELDSKVTEMLSLWEDSRKELNKQVREFEEVLERAQRTLISDDSPLLDWGQFGWTISPGAMIRDYYVRPETKEEADRLMESIHNESAIRLTFEDLKKGTSSSEQDIQEVEDLFYTGHYKACALLLFSMIDSIIIHAQDCTAFAGNRKPGGMEAIERYKNLAEPVDWPGLTTRMLSFISSIAALKAFFDKTTNFYNTNPVLNRHLTCHGMLVREVNRTDCAQLSLLYRNILHFGGDI